MRRTISAAVLGALLVTSIGSLTALEPATVAAGTASSEDLDCDPAVQVTFDRTHERYLVDVVGPCGGGGWQLYGNVELHRDPSTWSQDCQTYRNDTIACAHSYGEDLHVAFAIDAEGAFELTVTEPDEKRHLSGDLVRMDT